MKKKEKKDPHGGARLGRRSFLKACGAAGTAMAIGGFPAILKAKQKTIKIGSIQPVTGPISDIGLSCRRGNQLAVADINARGGIKSMGGAKLELLLGDSEAKETVARSEAERLIREGAVCLIGAFLSGNSMAIATLCEQRGIPFVIDISAADFITRKGYKFVVRNFPTTALLGGNAVRYIKQVIKESKVSPKRAVLTNTGDVFGKVMGGAYLRAHKKAAMPYEIVDHITYALGVKDLSAEVARIKAAKPDILLSICRSGDSRILTRELYKQRVELMGIISPGSPGWYEPGVLKDLGRLVEYVMDNVPWVNPRSPVYKDVNERFSKLYPGNYLDTNSGYAYTGIMIIADALERAGSTEPKALMKALKETHITEHPMVGGPIVFNENGDNPNAASALIQILNGKVQVVLPKEAAQAPFVFPWPKQLWERGV